MVGVEKLYDVMVVKGICNNNGLVTVMQMVDVVMAEMVGVAVLIG